VEILVLGLEMLRRVLPRLGPYLLIEIVLPGGTLVALLLYLYRRGNPDIGRDLSLRRRSAVRARARGFRALAAIRLSDLGVAR
jgi:hypothetical protein